MKMSTERVRNNTENVDQKYLKTYYSAIFISPKFPRWIFFEMNPGVGFQWSATNRVSYATASLEFRVHWFL
jgi:hypothetical protein